ncbi:MAG TPA: DUF4410 domain-containing protein [Candidatus Dormibacteraeota bacterium]|jgi:hypothetical protein|nr:DUF4410 domain-containing protein [Candidatus Dormibacteraeota bacterium]
MRKIWLCMLTALLCGAGTFAKDSEQYYKTAEVKHYTKMEGIELSDAFTDYLYAELRAELTKTKMFGRVASEGEVVDDADVPSSIVLNGQLIEFKKGNLAKEVIIGFSSGYRRLKLDTVITNRKDGATLFTLHTQVRTPPNRTEQLMAKAAAQEIAHELREEIKKSREKK